jgi:outer membrane protein assembly factor BamB
MRIPRTLLLAALLAGSPGSVVAEAPFWPQFHGPRRDNKSTETGLLKQWPAGGPTRLWTAEGIGHGFSSISIADGRIYTAGNLDENTTVTALDLDGKVVWQVENGAAWIEAVPGSRGTPTIDGDRLYHQSPIGNLVCLDAKTGKLRWAVNTLEQFGSENINWALSESLLIDGPRVICCPGGPHSAVVALDKLTGRVVWRSASAEGDLAGYSSPTLAEYAGRRMIFVMTSRAAIGVDADRGDLLWRFKHVTPFDENICQPIYHDGHVLISTRTTGTALLKLNVESEDVSVTPVWRSRELDNQHGGVILLGGYLYGSCTVANRAGWVCLDWETGRKMYAVDGVGKGSLTYADGMFYTLGERHTMGLVKAGPDTPEPISTFRLPEGGQGRSWAHPVVCGGRLYIRHGEFLYAYDVRAR